MKRIRIAKSIPQAILKTGIMILLVTGLSTLHCIAYTTSIYNYSDTGADGAVRNFRLMLPADTPVIRGLCMVIASGTADTRDLYQSSLYKEFVHLHGFGFLGSQGTANNFNNETVNALMRSLTGLANLSGHRELLNVPFVIYGFSGSGSYAWLIATQFPSRTIAISVANCGFSPNTNTVNYANALNVPACVMAGELDTTITTATIQGFNQYRPLGARWSMSQMQGLGHVESPQPSLGIPFLDHAIRLRYPTGLNPLNGPISLLPLPESNGWLADNATWKNGLTLVTNYASYPGNKKTASWLPDADSAFSYRALATFNRKLTITSVAGLSVVPTQALVFNPGTDLLISVSTANFAGWTKLEFYHEDVLLGTVTSGLPQFTFRNAQPGVYSFSVLGRNASGALTTSQPVYCIVRLLGAPVFNFTNAVPVVSLSSPVTGSVFAAPASLTLSAGASDSDGSITQVQFFNGSTLLATDTTAPYSFVWNNVPSGNYTLTAKATDNLGVTTSSTAVNVTVGTSSGTATGFVTSATLGTLRNDFTGWLGMEFAVGPNPITVQSLGRNVINGNSATHSLKLVTLATGADVPGSSVSVALAGAAPGTFKYSPLVSPITLAANTSYLLVSRETAGGDEWSHDTTAVTTTAAAVCNGPALSNGTGWLVRTPANTAYVPVNFLYTIVTPNQPPAVSFTSPTSGTTINAGTSLTLTASASDSDGSVSRVDFFANGVLLGSDSTGNPFSLPWNNIAAGNYSLAAVATDNKGASTTSAPVSIAVAAANASSFVTGVTLGTLRNNFTGFMGMQITVGPSPITISALGRYKISGNSRAHTMKIVEATTEADVPGSQVSVNLAAGTVNQFIYANLTAPIVLSANTSYYIVTQETSGADQWAYFDTTISHSTKATVDGSADLLSTGWIFHAGTDTTLGPVSFK